jgi:transposase-like protein
MCRATCLPKFFQPNGLFGHISSQRRLRPHQSVPRHRFPAEIISHAVWLYHVFSLSLRDVELALW